jgi:hypothetical protein
VASSEMMLNILFKLDINYVQEKFLKVNLRTRMSYDTSYLVNQICRIEESSEKEIGDRAIKSQISLEQLQEFL